MIVRLTTTGQAVQALAIGDTAYYYSTVVVETQDRGFLILGYSGASFLVKFDSALSYVWGFEI